MEHTEHRLALIDFSRRAVAAELSTGTSGNMSVRTVDGILITPSGLDPAQTAPDDICLVSMEGEHLGGERRPSSEVPMHLAVYRHTSAEAVVHTHPPYATAISLTHEELPAVHYNIAGLGGPVRVAPYATYGTPELAANISAALDGRSGAILQNHGMITHGGSLRSAYDRSVLLEWLSALFWRSLQVGSPRILTETELTDVVEQSRRLRYGSAR